MSNRRAALIAAAIVPALAAALLVQACAASPGVLGHPPRPAAHRRPAATLYIYASTVFGSGANVVTPVNTATGTPSKPIHVGVHRWMGSLGGMIVITPDGKTAYVATRSGTVIPISTATNTPGRPIHLGRDPFQSPYFIAVTPDGKTAYVITDGSRTATLIPISTATSTPGRPIHLGPFSLLPPALQGSQIVFTPDGKTAYVTTRSTGSAGREPSRATITPINTATNTPGRPIHIGKPGIVTGNIVITPDGRTVYAITEPGLTPISTATNTPGKPIEVGGAGGHTREIAITPDGKTAYVSTENGCVGGPQYCTLTVTPISTATNTPGTPIHLGFGPWDCTGQIAITPDGKTAYVATGSGLTPISTATNTPGTPIRIGVSPSAACNPDQIVFTPDGKTAYVATESGLTPISTATGRPGTPIKVGALGAPVQAIAITP